jgi:two-component system sensor histidine kinase MprB
MRRLSVRARLTAGSALLLAVAVVAAFAAAFFTVDGVLHKQLDTALRARANAIVSINSHGKRLRSLPRKVPNPKLGGAGGYIQFVQADGTVVLAPNDKTKLPTTGAQAVARGTRSAFFSQATVAGTHVRIYTTRVGTNAAVEVARPLTEIDHVLVRLRLLFLVISAAAIAAAIVAALLLARSALRPVRQLTEDAERIAGTGDLSERADQRPPGEIGRLAVAFNTMLDSLDASIRAQRLLVADASHELSTPLATARTNLELLERHGEMDDVERGVVLTDTITELREMTHLTEELVDLARGEAHAIDKERMRLDLVVEEVVAVAARRSGRRFETRYEPTVVDGSPVALARAISNLVDNALKWSSPGLPVDVTVSHGCVRVRDRGPGIPAEDLTHVFDRFYRTAAARTLPGSGLGLAIVRQIAQAHDGTATADRAADGGAILTLRIPESSLVGEHEGADAGDDGLHDEQRQDGRRPGGPAVGVGREHRDVRDGGE